MTRRALMLTLLSALLAAVGLIACGSSEEVEEVDTTPIVGLYELPISRNNQGSAPSDALRIEINQRELRVDSTKVLDLQRGRPAETEVIDHAFTKLRERITNGPARARASIKVHAAVPYLTLVETLNTLHGANLREVHFAVRTLGNEPSEGWMPLRNWQVVEQEAEIEWTSRPIPWSTFSTQWRAVYDACRAAGADRYINCDGPYATIAEGGNLGMELWTRGQGMKVTFSQTDPPEAEPGEGGGGGGVAMIEGVAPAPAPAAAEEEPPATMGAFSLRHQEATGEESAISSLVQPVCGNQPCQAEVVADATGQSMRVVSMLGAVFAHGFSEPEVAFRIPPE